MKDFVLSLLSRGYGRFVPDEDGNDGRLEVCFEPEVNVSYICVYIRPVSKSTFDLFERSRNMIFSKLGLLQLEISASPAASYEQWPFFWRPRASAT